MKYFLVLISFFILSQSALAKIKISSINATASTDICTEIITQAYNAIGEEVEFHIFPVKASIQNANLGKTDAELFRVKGIEKKFTNLIPVPVPINYINAVVVSRSDEFKIKTWQDLSPYKIGIRKGVVFSTVNTKGMDTFEADTTEQLFKMLEVGRLDVVVLTQANTLLNFKEGDYDSLKIIATVQKIPLFHYIHSSQKHLLEPLTKQLTLLQEQGVIDQVRDKYLKQFYK